jgi:5-methylcytosine-specific restriction endonuclease McrA
LVKRKRKSIEDGIFNPKPLRLPKSNILGIAPIKPKKDTRRAFTPTQKKEIQYQQDSKCASSLCHHKNLDPRTIEFDHKKPWASGGRTIKENGRALCPECHRIITHNERLRNIDKKRPARDSNPFSNLP